MSLVTDNWESNLNPSPKTFSIAKVLSATAATSGLAVTDTQNFFNKDCPFPVEVVGVQAVMRTITTSGHNGAGGAVSLTTQMSHEVDASPAAPSTSVWHTLVASDDIKGDAVDAQCFDAPGDGSKTLDQTYVAIPQGGSVRATLSAQVEDAWAHDPIEVEVLVIATFRPTAIKDRRYF